jgi:Tfp pilus assembly protein PilV
VNRNKRPGLSLLEVIIAMAIFLMSLVVIGKVVTLGGERSLDVEQQSEAAMLAQAKLHEVLIGAIPLASQADGAPFDEAPDYTWSLAAEQNSSVSNLWNVTVRVTRERKDGTKIEVVLSQMILDPSVRGSSQDTVSISKSSGSAGQGGAQGSSGSTQQQSSSPAAQSASPGASQRPPGSGSTGMGAAKTTGPSAAPPSTSQPKTTSPSATKTATTPSTSKGGK